MCNLCLSQAKSKSLSSYNFLLFFVNEQKAGTSFGIGGRGGGWRIRYCFDSIQGLLDRRDTTQAICSVDMSEDTWG